MTYPTFIATDTGGNQHELIVILGPEGTATLSTGEVIRVKSPLYTIQLVAGGAVNKLAKGRYQIVDTGEELTSDDPNAP